MFDTLKQDQRSFTGNPRLHFVAGTILLICVGVESIRLGLRYNNPALLTILALDGLAALTAWTWAVLRRTSPQSAFRLILICFAALQLVHLFLLH